MNYKNFIQEHIKTMEEELKDTGITHEQFKEDPDRYIAEYLDDKHLYNEELETLKKQYQKLGDISFQKVDESMNGEGDFVVGWANLTQEVKKCVLSTRK